MQERNQSGKWIKTRKEYKADLDGEFIQTGYILELSKPKLERKDQIDLIFKLLGTLAVIATLWSTCTTIKNVGIAQQNEYKKQSALYQLQTFTDVISVNNSIITAGEDSSIDNKNIEKLKNDLLPKIQLFKDESLPNLLGRFGIEGERYVTMNRIWTAINYDSDKYQQHLLELKKLIPYSNDQLHIQLERLNKDTSNCSLTYLATYLNEKVTILEQAGKVIALWSRTNKRQTSDLSTATYQLYNYYRHKQETIFVLISYAKKNKDLKIDPVSYLAQTLKYYIFDNDVEVDQLGLQISFSNAKKVVYQNYTRSHQSLIALNLEIVNRMKSINPILKE